MRKEEMSNFGILQGFVLRIVTAFKMLLDQIDVTNGGENNLCKTN
jgi:hypothetical protein